MKSAKELREELKQELKELQAKCPHKEKGVHPYSWAPGHYWGEVEVCKFCEKIIQRYEPKLNDSYSSSNDWENITIISADGNNQ